MPRVIDENIQIGPVLHEWSIPEYNQYERNRFWYVLMSIVGAALIIYAVLTGNFLFALIIVLFAIILFLQSHQEPIILPFRITELGVVVNNRFYKYSELNEFYILYNPPELKVLFIETNSGTRPDLRVPLMDMNPNEIRMTLQEFLTENLEKEEEPFGDMMARKWMFH